MGGMNSLRDPFAIRTKPPLAILVQRLASSPTTESNINLPTVAENTEAKHDGAIHDGAIHDEAIHDEAKHESIAEPMAFTMPRNVPSFDNPDREREDHIWSAVTGVVSARGGNTALGNITGAASGLFKDRELPMYKDKPCYTSSHRRTRIWKRKSYWVFFLIVVFGLYWLGFLSGDGKQRSKGIRFLRGGKPPSESEDVINWEERREKVKQAFLQSWEGYERHAWGMFSL